MPPSLRRQQVSMRLAASLLLAAACSPAAPEEPPAAVFMLGALQGEARWIGAPNYRPEILLTFRNTADAPAYWRGEPSNSSEGWRQPPRDLDGKIWYADFLPRTGHTFEEAQPFPSDNSGIWRIAPGQSRHMTITPFRGAEPGPAVGFASWEYEVAICMPADRPPAHPLDYRTADLRLRWSREKGLRLEAASGPGNPASASR